MFGDLHESYFAFGRQREIAGCGADSQRRNGESGKKK